MFGHAVARQPAPMLAMRGMGLRLRHGVDALGNALGESLASRSSSSTEPLVVAQGNLPDIPDYKPQAVRDVKEGFKELPSPGQLGDSVRVVSVNSGDTLSGVAGTNDPATLDRIAAYNGLASRHQVAAGSDILIPSDEVLARVEVPDDVRTQGATGAKYYAQRQAAVAVDIGFMGSSPASLLGASFASVAGGTIDEFLAREQAFKDWASQQPIVPPYDARELVKMAAAQSPSALGKIWGNDQSLLSKLGDTASLYYNSLGGSAPSVAGNDAPSIGFGKRAWNTAVDIGAVIPTMLEPQTDWSGIKFSVTGAERNGAAFFDALTIYGAAKGVASGFGSAENVAVLGTKLGNDSATLNAAKWIKPVDGYYDVVVHGTPDAVAINRGGTWVYLDQRSLATYISRQADYDGSAVRLVSCSTGQLDFGMAQNLSNKMGVQIMAPTDTLFVFPSGRTVIGPNQFTNSGEWRFFSPTQPRIGY
jgi:LysM domain